MWSNGVVYSLSYDVFVRMNVSVLRLCNVIITSYQLCCMCA